MTMLDNTLGHFIALMGIALAVVGGAVLIEWLAARGKRVARTLWPVFRLRGTSADSTTPATSRNEGTSPVSFT